MLRTTLPSHLASSRQKVAILKNRATMKSSFPGEYRGPETRTKRDLHIVVGRRRRLDKPAEGLTRYNMRVRRRRVDRVHPLELGSRVVPLFDQLRQLVVAMSDRRRVIADLKVQLP